MQRLTPILILILAISCNETTNEADSTIQPESVKLADNDSVISVSTTKSVSDTSIVNTTDKTIDILFNGADNYLGGQRNPKMNFRTECMVCEPVQVYGEGFLFGKRLYVTKDSITIYNKDRNISDTAGIIRVTSYYGEGKAKKLQFSQGNLLMKYQGQSCNDAYFVYVNLSYNKGSIKFDHLLNASFFEYDLDNNGNKEQYLLGTRNCTQEVVLIRINNDNE